jgi:hypothetical protein
MKINGNAIDQAVIDACLARMKSGMFFRAYQIEDLAANLGVSKPNGHAMRVADRLIQQQRKKGNIAIATASRDWKWIGEGAK